MKRQPDALLHFLFELGAITERALDSAMGRVCLTRSYDYSNYDEDY